MNDDQLRNQITAYVNIVKIPQENKDKILSKLPTSTPEQLEDVKTILMQQMVFDVFFDEIEKFQNSEKLMDETDYEELFQTIVKKMEDAQQVVLTEAELNQIRSSLQGIQQNASASAPASVSAPSVQPVMPTPVSPVPVAPAVPVETAPVFPVPPKV